MERISDQEIRDRIEQLERVKDEFKNNKAVFEACVDKIDAYRIVLGEKLVECPRCYSASWYEGPRGGLAQNIMCGRCGAKYNHTPFGLEPIGAEAVA